MPHDTGKPAPPTPAEVRANCAEALRHVGRICAGQGGLPADDELLVRLAALSDDIEAR